MANFTAKDVQTLREKTGVGMMDCKKALTEADGDFERATELLREKGLAAAAKKADRIAAEGLITCLTHNGVSVVLEINTETDFVAKNEDFVKFANNVALTVAENKPADVDALLTLKLSGSDMTVEEALRDRILVIGENIKVRRFYFTTDISATYVHGGGIIGVLVSFDTDAAEKEEFKAYAKDIAMQIAAISPRYIAREDVPANVVEKEKEILTAQAMGEGKPQNIAEKMVVGRISKFFKDICLLEQSFVKNGDITVKEYTENTAKELGASIKLKNFVRFEKGEGLEKRADDFADEVASIMK